MKRLFLLPLLLSGASLLLAAPPARPPRGTKWFLATQYSGAIRCTLKGGDPELQSRDRYANNGERLLAETFYDVNDTDRSVDMPRPQSATATDGYTTARSAAAAR